MAINEIGQFGPGIGIAGPGLRTARVDEISKQLAYVQDQASASAIPPYGKQAGPVQEDGSVLGRLNGLEQRESDRDKVLFEEIQRLQNRLCKLEQLLGVWPPA